MDATVADPGVWTAREFERLYAGQVACVFEYLARRVGADLAEDITAEAFARAWESQRRFDPSRGSFAAWVFGIATNLLRHHRRTEMRQLRAFARTRVDVTAFDEVAVLDRLVADSDWPLVAGALADLGDVDRDVLTLHVWAGLSYRGIADALDLPIGTVKSRLNRARVRLADQVREVAVSAAGAFDG